MKRNTGSTKKYMLLASVLLLMLVLCGCRTRLTNNTEVTASISDEDGLLTGTYEMRRGELGIPVAQKPVFTGWGSDEDDYDYTDDNPFDNYEPNPDDGWVEPDIVTADDDSTVSGSGTTGGTTGSTTKKKPAQKTDKKTNSDKVTITLDLKDGEGSKNTLTVKKDTPYKNFLPSDALRDGYVFVEWTTDRANKNPVDLNTKATKDQTLYAHWKKAEKEPEKKTEYKVTWEYDSDVTVADADKLPATIENGGKFPDPLPVAHKKDYHFLGWDNGSGLIKPGQSCSGDSRLVAKFDSWAKIYNDARPADDKMQSVVADDGLDDLVRGKAWDPATETGPAYVIIKLKDTDFTEEAAKTAADEKRAEKVHSGDEEITPYSNSVIIVVPDDAAGKKNALYYQLLIHNEMYPESGLVLDKAAEDTEAVSTAYYVSMPE